MRFQIVARDEYNMTSIADTCKDLETTLQKVKTLVTNENLDNALTLDEQKANWKAYWIEVLDEDGNYNPNVLYAGDMAGKPTFYNLDGDTATITKEVPSNMRFLIGSVFKKLDRATKKVISEDIYAEELGRKVKTPSIVSKLDNQNLQSKTVYYVKVIK